MNLPVSFKEEARQDIARAFEWYDSQKVGLGDRFLTELNQIINQIGINPHLFQIRRKNIRLGLLKHFPYLVVYEAEENQIIIYKIIHAHRNPQKRFRRKKQR
jgi:plasmid stabilization system protein ParE